MDEHGYVQLHPAPARPDSFPTQPFVDLKSGYVLRSLDQFPKQGLKTPWRLHQNYARDILMLRRGPVEDEAIEFAAAPVAASARDDGEPTLLTAVPGA